MRIESRNREAVTAPSYQVSMGSARAHHPAEVGPVRGTAGRANGGIVAVCDTVEMADRTLGGNRHGLTFVPVRLLRQRRRHPRRRRRVPSSPRARRRPPSRRSPRSTPRTTRPRRSMTRSCGASKPRTSRRPPACVRMAGFHREGSGDADFTPRILPLDESEADPAGRAMLESIVTTHGRTTNMKRTLARSPVALDALMTWYDLRDAVVPFLGERLTTLFAHAISAGHRLPGLLDVLPPDPDRFGRGSRIAPARRLGADRRRLRPATGRRSARRLRRPLRPPRRAARARSDRHAHGLRRADGRHQPVQQRAAGRPRRIPAPLSQGRK